MAFTILILGFKVVLPKMHQISPHQFEILKTDQKKRNSADSFSLYFRLDTEPQTNFSVI